MILDQHQKPVAPWRQLAAASISQAATADHAEVIVFPVMPE